MGASPGTAGTVYLCKWSGGRPTSARAVGTCDPYGERIEAVARSGGRSPPRVVAASQQSKIKKRRKRKDSKEASKRLVNERKRDCVRKTKDRFCLPHNWTWSLLRLGRQANGSKAGRLLANAVELMKTQIYLVLYLQPTDGAAARRLRNGWFRCRVGTKKQCRVVVVVGGRSRRNREVEPSN